MNASSFSGARLLRTIALGLFAVAVLALVVTYLGVRTKATVEAQVPYLASGGLLSIICAAFGSGVLVASSGADEDVRAIRQKLDDLAEFVAIETDLLHQEVADAGRAGEVAHR